MREAKLDDFDDNDDECVRDILINNEFVKVSTEPNNDITISEFELGMLIEGMGIELKNE